MRHKRVLTHSSLGVVMKRPGDRSQSRNNAVVRFVDAAGGDFRFSPLDAVGRDAGKVLLNSPSINDGRDIAGEPRDDH